MRNLVLAAASLAALSGTAQAAVSISVEDAGVQRTTLVKTTSVETFATAIGGADNATNTPAIADFTSDFGGSAITGLFQGFELGTPAAYNGDGANFGGAQGSTQYGVVHGQASIKLSQKVRYLGLWAAALDGDNTVELLSDGVSLGSFQLVSSIGTLGSAYFGNPNNGADQNEAFAFVNFLSDDAFDEVRFIQSGGGFEFDDVTVGGAVPEPATWGMMVLGFGLAGGALRSRRRTITVAA
jgi:hypothetical protein